MATSGKAGKRTASKKASGTAPMKEARKKAAGSGKAAPRKRSKGGTSGAKRGRGVQPDELVQNSALSEKAGEIDRRLGEHIPDAGVELDHTSAFELLVATILAAQCTDKRVNEVTKRLFRKYRKPEDYLAVDAEELESDIQETGFYRQKTRSIRGAMETLIARYGGQVPANMDELTSLPGVGRKTANVLLGNAFGIPGIVVDTHVTRVSKRLGLTDHTDAVKIERALGELLPQESWSAFGQRMVLHGRYICLARTPKCDECALIDQCDYFIHAASGRR